MKFFTGLSLVASALAVRMDVTKRDSPLKVEIQSVGNSAVKAVITNTGSEPIKLMKTGSILDKTAVEKAEIFSGGTYTVFSTRLLFDPGHIMHGVLTPCGAVVSMIPPSIMLRQFTADCRPILGLTVATATASDSFTLQSFVVRTPS